MPQVKSENLFAASFARTTGAAINGEFEKGACPSRKEHFQTSSASAFGTANFRRLNGQVCPAEAKD